MFAALAADAFFIAIVAAAIPALAFVLLLVAFWMAKRGLTRKKSEYAAGHSAGNEFHGLPSGDRACHNTCYIIHPMFCHKIPPVMRRQVHHAIRG
jgi:hypothetical protein